VEGRTQRNRRRARSGLPHRARITELGALIRSSCDPWDPDRFHLILEEHQTTDGHPTLARWIDDMAARPSC